MSTYILQSPSRIPWQVWRGLVSAAVAGHSRSPASDGKAVWSSLSPSPSVDGVDYLPERGPYVVVANHLNGPGVWVGLEAALIAAVVGDRSPTVRLRGVGVAEYQAFRLAGIPIPDSLTALVFRRFYAVYDIIRMPRVREGAGARSRAVRRILAALRAGDIVLLFPEGQNVENFTMRRLQPGVGNLLRIVHKSGTPVVPAGVAPTDGSFELRFGAPIVIPADESDGVEELVGKRISALIPAQYRGTYGDLAANVKNSR